MKKNKRIWLVFALVSLLIAGCKTDIDMRNFDGKTQLELGIAMPVGSMRMTLGDILGVTPAANYIYYDSVGTLVLRVPFNVKKAFHPVDITEKGTDTELKHLHMTDYYNPGYNDFDNTRVRLTYNIGMKLKDVNDSLDYERFDAVMIREAEFISTINYRKDYGNRSEVKSEWIEKIDMILGDQFTREAGKTIPLYDRESPVEGQQTLVYGEPFRMRIDEFTMSLLKDPNLVGDSSVYNHNVMDSIFFKIRVQLRIPETTLYFDDNSAFEYDMKLGMLKYRAVWGMFGPSDAMRDEGTFNISEEWGPWKTMNDMKLPLFEPEIKLSCVTQIAGRLMLNGDYLYAKDLNKNDSVFAMFDGHKNLIKVFSEEESLNPYSPVGDSTTLHLNFSKDPSEGELDKLFNIHPDMIGYKFFIDFFDPKNYPVARITDNTDIEIKGLVRAPFTFNKGLTLQYGDTIRDLNLKMLSKDSLYHNLTWLDSLRSGNVVLALKAENTLPMAVDGELIFLDNMGQRVMTKDPTGNIIPLRFTETDTIHIAAPVIAANGQIEQAGSTNLVLHMTEDQLDAFSRVANIKFTAHADDKALQALQDANPGADIYPIHIDKTSALRMRIGVAASVEALLDIMNFTKEK